MKKMVLIILLFVLIIGTLSGIYAYSSTLTVRWIYGRIYSEISAIIPNTRNIPYVQLNNSLDFT